LQLEEVRDYVDMFHGAPLKVISDCLRGCLTAAPGNDLIAVDFSQIEARVLPWLAGQDNKLEIFRQGKDIYLKSAHDIYGVPENMITKDQRLVGKVGELALGYQGGVGAFQSMAKQYLVKVPDALADEIKMRWRNANPKIVEYWFRLDNAATAAVSSPGEKFHAGPKGRHVTFLKKGSFLMCRLPSGRVISYPFAAIRKVTVPWGDIKESVVYMGEKTHQWKKIVAYGGLLAENVTQAVARDLLRDAMFRWEAAGYNVVMHVHDELVAEVRADDETKTLEEAIKLMTVVPAWARGIPIAADGWKGKRYRK